METSETAARRDLLAKVPVLADLAPRELEALAQVAHTKRLAAREVLFHKGDPGSQVYVVVRGRLRIYAQSADGTDVVFGIMDPGEVCGEMALLAGCFRTATAFAIEATELLGLDRRDFLALLRSRPQLSIRLLQVLAERVRRISEFVEDTVFLDLPTRLAKKLLELAESHGEALPDGKGVEITVPLTQEELAGMIGATRPSVNKVLGWYEDQGAIQRRGRRMWTCWRPSARSGQRRAGPASRPRRGSITDRSSAGRRSWRSWTTPSTLRPAGPIKRAPPPAARQRAALFRRSSSTARPATWLNRIRGRRP